MENNGQSNENKYSKIADGERIVETVKGYVKPIAEAVASIVRPVVLSVKPVLEKAGPVFARMSSTNKRIIAILGIAAAAGTGTFLCAQCGDSDDQAIVVPPVPENPKEPARGKSNPKSDNKDIRSIPEPGTRKISPEYNEPLEVLTEGAVKAYKFDNAEITGPWYWLLTTARAEGWKGGMDSNDKGLRTKEIQKKLWLRYIAKKGPAAFDPDGRNAHLARHMILNFLKKKNDWDIAVDTDKEHVLELMRIAKKHGVILHRPYLGKGELWHVESKKPFSVPPDFKLPKHSSIYCLDKKGNVLTNKCSRMVLKPAGEAPEGDGMDEVAVEAGNMEHPNFDVVAEAARARSLLKDIETYNHVDRKENRTKDDESFNVLLAVRRNDSSKIEYVTLKPDDRVTKGFKVTRGKPNGVNTAYKIEEPRGFFTLAIKRIKNVAGTNREIVYSPYSPKLDTPEVRGSGADYLNSLIGKGKAALDAKNVKSDTNRKVNVTSTVPDRLIFTVALIEHMDYFDLKRGKTMEALAKRTLAIIGLNGRNAYDYVCSDPGARGLFQLMPATYKEIVRMTPSAKLKSDHLAGSMEHMNAVQTAIVLTDHNMSLLANNDKNLAEIMKSDSVKRGMLLAAVYNGGNTRVVKAYKEHGDNWRNHVREETKGYVEKFVAVMKMLEEGKLP